MRSGGAPFVPQDKEIVALRSNLMRANATRLNAIAEAVTRIESRSDDVYDAGMKSLL